MNSHHRLPSPGCSANRITLPVLILSAVLLSACGPEKVAEVTEVARPVKLLTVTPAENTTPLEFPASIRARNSVELAFNVPGQVNEFPVLEGLPVQAGDFLASLDRTEYQARLLAAEAASQLAQVEFDRYTDLSASGAVAVAELDQKRAALQAAKSELDLIRKNFDDTVLRAPFDGVVSRRLVQRFANVQAKQGVLLFQALQPLDVVIDVPEPLVLRSTGGRESIPTAVVRFDAMNGVELPIELREVSTEADPQTQTFRIVFSLEDSGGYTVLPGMSAVLVAQRASAVDGSPVYVLPPLAVATQTDGTRYVWLFDPETSRVRQQPVEVGLLRNDGLEILGGLSTGDQIVVAGLSQLKPDMQVRPASL